MNYGDFFGRLSGGHSPFPWQTRLAQDDWPELLDIPTGLGKTVGVVGAWLWRRLNDDISTGRRLVYCLPMRSLVRQVVDSCRVWCERAKPCFGDAGRGTPGVHVLMGGETEDVWERDPGAEAILVGTQDMLISRALCRGYGMSRYGWPIPFALLSADCFWVLDETQLMGVGVETSSQLQALRETIGTQGSARTIWMSATLDRRRIDTYDRIALGREPRILSLSDQDRATATAKRRIGARKRIALETEFRLAKDDVAYARAVAARAAGLHEERGGLTLVLLNRVSRAQEVFRALDKAGVPEEERSLVHSRFRAAERSVGEELLLQEGNRIVVATQAIEAGIDVSARTMITELAPHPSLVQRLGRLNRYGEEDDALAVWIDVEAEGKTGHVLCLPYDPGELRDARRILKGLEDAGPASLGAVQYEPALPVRPILRRKDLLDLFDTTPDLLGYDLDVSRYVRDGDDTDVLCYWRDFAADKPSAEERAPRAEEVCRVSIGTARKFLDSLTKVRKKRRGAEGAAKLRAFRWCALDGEFLAADATRPGDTLLLHSTAGGYGPSVGFTGAVGAVVPPTPAEKEDLAASPEAMNGDPRTSIGRWVTLDDHLRHVAGEAKEIVAALGLPPEFSQAVTTAAAWHDVGKAHAEFQRRLVEPVADDPDRPPGDGPWAKSDHHLPATTGRPGFRHELASALACLQSMDAESGRFRDLVAYLIAAHHGKVRLSIRSLPMERLPDPDPDRPFARGVWDGDPLPGVRLPEGATVGPVTLDLSPVEMGEGSWLERTLALRDAEDLGPFRLAFLETLVRLADWRASGKEAIDDYA